MSLLLFDRDNLKIENKLFFFQNQGHSIRSAHSIKEFESLLLLNSIHLVIANWNTFPEHEKIIDRCKYQELPIIFFFDNWNEEEINAAFKAGANDIMVFPFRPTELTFRLGRWLNKV